MSDHTELKKRPWGSILSTVPPSQPKVHALRRWDEMEKRITARRNYLVEAQANKHRCQLALEEADTMEAEAKRLLAESENEWREASKTLIGVDIDKADGNAP